MLFKKKKTFLAFKLHSQAYSLSSSDYCRNYINIFLKSVHMKFFKKLSFKNLVYLDSYIVIKRRMPFSLELE